MSPLLASHHAVFRLNTRLFLNCLAGVDDASARHRASDATNSLSFVAVHLVDTRHFMAGALGLTADNPFAALLQDARSIDDVAAVPGVDAVRAAWQDVSGVLDRGFDALSDEALGRPAPQRFPVGDRSVLGMIAFLMQHDAYHVGQMAFLRKLLGFGAMSYR